MNLHSPGWVLSVGYWVLLLAGFWVLRFWVLKVVTLGCWYPNSGFEEVAEGRNTLLSPCGAAWDLPKSQARAGDGQGT